MSPGYHYTKVLDKASVEQKIKLCPPRARTTLEPLCSDENHQLDPVPLLDSLIQLEIETFSGFSDSFQYSSFYQVFLNTADSEKIEELCERMHLSRDGIAEHLNAAGSNKAAFDKYFSFGVSSDDDKQPVQGQGPEVLEPTYGLRYYQLVGARDICKQLRTSKRALYHCPTGGGKTRTAMAVVTQHIRENGPTSVLWLASTVELVDQAEEAFRQAWQWHGDYGCVVWPWRGGSEEFDPPRAGERNRFLIATVQNLDAARKRKPDLLDQLCESGLSLVVFDEAHQSIAPTYQNMIKKLVEGGCALLGLSATPGRSDSATEDTQALATLYDNKKVTMWRGEKHASPVGYLVEEGYLAKPDFKELEVRCDISLPKPGQDEDYGSKVLDALGNNFHRNVEIVKAVCALLEKHKKIIVFTASVLSSMICAALLRSEDKDVYSAYIDAKVPKDRRLMILNDYKNDANRSAVVFNYNILTAGFDAPSTSAVVIARPTKSVGLYSQMVGRALRGEKSGGNKNAEILTVIDPEISEFNDVQQTFQHWDKEWQ